MKDKKKNLFSTILVLVLILGACSSKDSGSKSNEINIAEMPILIGPPGTRFWTTYSNAINLFLKKVADCSSTHFDLQISRTQDSLKNRYMSIKKIGEKAKLQLVAKADNRYEDIPSGGKIICHKCPEEAAPWIGKSSSAYFLKKDKGVVRQIGLIDSLYRELGGRKKLMTKGMSEGEKWTGDNNGVIYQLNVENKITPIGKYDLRWVTPTGSVKSLAFPILMSKGSDQNSPWIGELAGIIYIHKTNSK